MKIPKQNTVAHFTRTGCYSLSDRGSAILDCVISCLRKKLVKKQITIFAGSPATVAALEASGTKSSLVADSKEYLMALLSEVNQVTIMLVPGHSGIQQNETADRLGRKGARTRGTNFDAIL